MNMSAHRLLGGVVHLQTQCSTVTVRGSQMRRADMKAGTVTTDLWVAPLTIENLIGGGQVSSKSDLIQSQVSQSDCGCITCVIVRTVLV